MVNQRQHLILQIAQVGGLAILLCGQTAGAIAKEVDLKSSSAPHSDSLSLIAGSIPISRADANTIENWLLRDIRKSHFDAFGIGGSFFWQAELVLARPNAKTELVRIVARKDLPPYVRIYAQEMLMKAGQPRNPSLVEDYCYTLQNSGYIGLLHEIWGLPGVGVGDFGRTLISYRQAALPCLARLLNDNNELIPGGTGEANAIVSIGQYRISDLVAYLIAQILDLPYNNDANPAVRDQQIQDLRRRFGIPSDTSEKQIAPVRFSPNTIIDEVMRRSNVEPTLQFSKP
jgi:hypothetical protein